MSNVRLPCGRPPASIRGRPPPSSANEALQYLPGTSCRRPAPAPRGGGLPVIMCCAVFRPNYSFPDERFLGLDLDCNDLILVHPEESVQPSSVPGCRAARHWLTV